VTLTFDLLTSKSNQFIFVPNCTRAATMMDVRMDSPKQNVSGTVQTVAKPQKLLLVKMILF